MLAQVTSCAVVGLDGALVDVQVYISNGQAGMTVVGLPDASVQESRERVRAAADQRLSDYQTTAPPTRAVAPPSARVEMDRWSVPARAANRKWRGHVRL